MSDTAARRKVLETRRAELVQRIDAIQRDYGRGLDADSEERAVQLENAEVLAALNEQAYAELKDIDAELARLPAS